MATLPLKYFLRSANAPVHCTGALHLFLHLVLKVQCKKYFGYFKGFFSPIKGGKSLYMIHITFRPIAS